MKLSEEKSYKCLSIRQPWVWAIFFAGKDIENRDWRTSFRGRLLVHASNGMTKREYEDFAYTADLIGIEKPVPAFDELARGCLFGSVTITDCVTDYSSPWFFGRYGFVLADPKPLPEPIPYKGQRGLFDVPTSIFVGRRALAEIDRLAAAGGQDEAE